MSGGGIKEEGGGGGGDGEDEGGGGESKDPGGSSSRGRRPRREVNQGERTAGCFHDSCKVTVVGDARQSHPHGRGLLANKDLDPVSVFRYRLY